MAAKRDDIGLILAKLEDIGRITEENTHALVGKNGVPGLVGNFTALCTRVSALEQLLNNDIAHLSAKVDMLFTLNEKKELAVSAKETAALARVRQLEDENVIKKSDVLKEWIKPIVVSILTAILVYFIVTNGIAGK